MEFTGDITQEIRDSLDAQGYTISYMGTNETYEQLVRIVLRDISVTGGSTQAAANQVEQAIDWARVNNITPRPMVGQTPADPGPQTLITTTPGGARVNKTFTQEQLDNAIDGSAFVDLVPANLTGAATAAMGGLALIASQQGLRYLTLTPLFLNRWGLPLAALEVIDLLTPDTDIPTLSDIPGYVMELLRGTGAMVVNESGDQVSTIENVLNFLLPGTPFGSRAMANPFSVGQVFMQNQIVKTWEANGVWFARQADGLNWVQRLNGSIKSFRNVKPIVLTSAGASTPKIAERALKALYNQYKGMRKAFKPFDKPAPRRSAPRAPIGDNVTQIRN